MPRHLLIAALLTAIALATQAQTPSQDALHQGLAAANAGHLPEAQDDYKNALALDPTNTTATYYLALTYVAQVVPNLQTPENLANANTALTLLQQIPPDYPNYHDVLKQLATLYRNIDRLDEARTTELAALQLLPNDPDTHYTIGVIDWTQAYHFAVATLAAENLKDDGYGDPKMSPTACQTIKAHNTPLVDDAILHLTRAIDLKPNNTAAMQYLNLVYRRHADFACTDPTARKQDLALANQWAGKALAARPQPTPPLPSPNPENLTPPLY